MNNNLHYERRHDRTIMAEQALPQPQPQNTVAALAVHRDPSVPTSSETDAKVRRGIAWVRPSELPRLIGSRWAARGIDLQSELVRRSRRAPTSAAKAGRRVSRTAIARQEPVTSPVATTEELGL
jgi:hypothetical protein